MSKYGHDEERLIQLKSSDRKVWKQFFDENLDAFLLFVVKFGGVQKEQAFELYQEALVILHRNVSESKLEAPLRSSLQTYLFAIGKNLCRRNGGGHLNFPENIPDIPQNPFEEDHDRRHNAALVKSLLDRLGGKCQDFLTQVFLEEKPQPDIMREMEIPSDEAFRKRKHDCLKKMRSLL